MTLSADQELLEHEMRAALVAIQTKHFETQVKWEPWKAVAAGVGSGITVAIIGILTLLLRAAGH